MTPSPPGAPWGESQSYYCSSKAADQLLNGNFYAIYMSITTTLFTFTRNSLAQMNIQHSEHFPNNTAVLPYLKDSEFKFMLLNTQ